MCQKISPEHLLCRGLQESQDQPQGPQSLPCLSLRHHARLLAGPGHQSSHSHPSWCKSRQPAPAGDRTVPAGQKAAGLSVVPYLVGQGWPGGRATGAGAWQHPGHCWGSLGAEAGQVHATRVGGGRSSGSAFGRGDPDNKKRWPKPLKRVVHQRSPDFPTACSHAGLAELAPAPAKGNSFCTEWQNFNPSSFASVTRQQNALLIHTG